MNQHDLGDRRPGRPLGMDEHLHARFGLEQLDFDREVPEVHRPPPVIPGDGQQMGIPEQRDKWWQETILGDWGAVIQSGGKKRADKEAAPEMDQAMPDVVQLSFAMRRPS
jgi:hypothetical protein